MMTDKTYTEVELLLAENKKLRSQIKQLSEGKNAWYETLFNKSNEAIAVCEEFSNFPSVIIDCNETFAKVLRRKVDSLLGVDFMDLLRKGEKKKFFVRSFDHSKANHSNTLALVFVDAEKKELNIDVSTQKIRSIDRDLVIVTLHPFNEGNALVSEGVEQALASSNQVFFTFKNDDIRTFSHVSLSSYKVTGFSSKQLLLNPFIFWNNCHPDDLQKIANFIKKENSYYQDLNIRFVRKDKQMIWINFIVIRNTHQEGDENTFFAIGKECTSQQRKLRLTKKRERFHTLLFSFTKMLMNSSIVDAIPPIGLQMLQALKVERLSFYVFQGDTVIDENIFEDYITLDEKIFLPSNDSVWKEYAQHFKSEPVVTYQSSHDRYFINKEIPHFFTNKNTQSALLVPIMKPSGIVGFLCASSIRKSCFWDRSDISLMTELSEILSISDAYDI